MLNKQGKKVRLTFKMELDQLWIGTQQRTDKVPMSSIKAVVSEPIVDHDDYHIVVSTAIFCHFCLLEKLWLSRLNDTRELEASKLSFVK